MGHNFSNNNNNNNKNEKVFWGIKYFKNNDITCYDQNNIIFAYIYFQYYFYYILIVRYHVPCCKEIVNNTNCILNVLSYKMKKHKLVRPYSAPRSRLENFNRKLR